jgi:hypothetical protein
MLIVMLGFAKVKICGQLVSLGFDFLTDFLTRVVELVWAWPDAFTCQRLNISEG